MAETKLVRGGRSLPQLDTLPQEVHDLIFEYVCPPPRRPKHFLWPILFVSRKMYHAVLPCLYRQIRFAVDSSVGPYKANYRLLQMADKENQGLLHIEDVELFPRDELKRKPYMTADYPDAIQLIASIPRDSLRRFNWDSWHQIPVEVLRLLWKRQHKLTNVEFIACLKPLDELIDELGLVGGSFGQHATDLRIADVADGKISVAAVQILKNRPQIDTLTLEFWSIKSRMDEFFDDEDSDDEAAVFPDQRIKDAYHKGLLKALFGLPRKPQGAKPLLLVTLNLHCVDLWHGPCYMFHSIDLAVLKNLRIVGCRRPDVFLTRMSELPAEKRPHLRLLRIYHEESEFETAWVSDDDETDRTIDSVNEILLSVKDSLQTLWIVMRGINGPERLLGPMAPGIANHGGSLRHLTVDVRGLVPSSRWPKGRQCVGWFPHQAWEHLCGSMAQLEQLYVPFPPVVADEHVLSQPDFEAYLGAALQLPTLRMLNINTWPYPLHTSILPPPEYRHPIPFIVGPWRSNAPTPVPEDFYKHCLEYIAQNIMELRDELISNPHQPLDIIGFGLREKHHYMVNLQDSLFPVYFVASRATSLGKAFTLVKETSLKDMRHSDLAHLISEAWNIGWMAKRWEQQKKKRLARR
ncbi:MAG: hypothetical protein Q9166_004781 [cf. Caloplaca sp. 2 TL-2023]